MPEKNKTSLFLDKKDTIILLQENGQRYGRITQLFPVLNEKVPQTFLTQLLLNFEPEIMLTMIQILNKEFLASFLENLKQRVNDFSKGLS